MDNLDLNTIWQSVLVDIKNKSQVPSFRTWFEKSSLENIRGGEAIINLSSGFAISYVQVNFDDKIKDFLSEHIGSPIKIIKYQEIKKEVKKARSTDPNQPTLIDV